MTYIDRIFQNENLLVLNNKIYKLIYSACPIFNTWKHYPDLNPETKLNVDERKMTYDYKCLKINDKFYELELIQEIELQTKHPFAV